MPNSMLPGALRPSDNLSGLENLDYSGVV